MEKRKGKKKVKSAYKITKVLLNKVKRLAKQGLSIEQIGVSIGWGKTQMYDIKKKNAEFSNAIKEGQTANIKEVVNAMSKIAKGYETTEIHTTEFYTEEETEEGESEKETVIKKNTKTKTIKKSVAPNSTAGIFILTNRDSDNWKHKSEQVVSGGLDVRIGAITKKDAKVVKDLFDDITEE